MLWQPAEGKVKSLGIEQFLMADALFFFSVQLTVLDKVEVFIILLSTNIQPLIFFCQIDTKVIKEWNSKVITCFSWAGWIKSESRPYIPSRKTTIILIARISIPASSEGFLTEGLD